MSSSQTELSIFDEKADQVRLKEITVYNWGSFNGLHTLHIDSEGTLITGDNGSGKSTIIDGLMTLIRPAGKVSYNIAAAQEQKKDRTLVSYMRGSYGTTVTDEGQISRNLRSNSVVTVLKSLYEFDISHQKVVLLGVFYINGDSNALSDVKRIYAVANSDIDVARMLKAFGNLDTRNLKNYLNSIEGCTVCDDSFSAYETHFRRRLRMDNKNATALLSRALGLKRIDDLTGLIRSLVLEPGEVKEDAINTIAQFEDLKEIHNRLEDARTQSNTLKDLPKDNNRYEHSLNLVTRYEKAIADAETYIAKCALEAYSSEVSDNEKSLSLLNLHLQDIEDQIRKARIILDNCNTSLKEGGGGRTIKIREEIDTEKLHLRDARKEQTAYNTLALALGLKAASDESIFLANLKVLEELKPDLVKKNETCIEEQVSLATRKRALETAKKDQENILYELKKRPGSNVSFRYQNF
ncbi:MAG: ATP-binding protein, partial [Succinivibrio sp.]